MAPISASSLGRHAENPLPDVRGTALLAKGFRPFFLLAPVFAAIAIPLWLAVLEGHVVLGPYAGALSWHAHEMLFGFTAAVIAGFLLTAAGNWTGRETATGRWLAGLVGLWLLGRGAMIAAAVLPPALVALLDAAFMPALAATLIVPIRAARNRRNYPIVALVVLLALTNVVFHWSTLGARPELAARALRVTVDIVVVLIAAIGGRVIPFFTRNATGVETIRSSPVVDRIALGSLVLVAIADALALSATVLAPIAAIAGVSSGLRAFHFGARHARAEPLLWVLHIGYAWVPVGLLLRAAAIVFGLSPFLALHALTVGAIGTLTLGMMARVALGHTGRPLRAPPIATAAFVLITLSAIVRVLMPLLLPAAWMPALTLSGILWSAAFTAFVIGYGRILVLPRADGKAG